MIQYLKSWAPLKSAKRAVTALEYGLIAAAIIVAISATVFSMGSNLDTMFGSVNTKLAPTAATTTPPA